MIESKNRKFQIRSVTVDFVKCYTDFFFEVD